MITNVFRYLLPCVVLLGCSPSATTEFDRQMAVIEQDSGGSIGVYAIDPDTGRELAFRADERFAMASTFKPLLVAAVLARVQNGWIDLDDTMDSRAFELQPYSPVVETVADNALIPVSELCRAATTLGDNTATNMLLSLVGGPAGFTGFLRQLGDDVTRLDREEIELNANTPGDERDTTTPRAMAHSLQQVLLGDVLEEKYATMLQNWMVASTTGRTRLRAGLPGSWRVGDKTGTGMNGAANNVAIAWPSARPVDAAPIIIAVYMSWSEQSVPELNAFHAQIAELIAAEL